MRLANLAFAAVYVVVAGGLGIWNAWRVLHPVVTLLASNGSSAEKDRLDVLAAPRRIFAAQAFLWALGAAVFFGLNTRYSVRLAVSVSLIVGLAGWATSCLTYLLAERALRPVARRVLKDGIPERRFVRSVTQREMFAWALGTGVTLLGILAVGVVTMTDPARVDTLQLATTTVVLCGITIVVGFVSSYVAAQASRTSRSATCGRRWPRCNAGTSTCRSGFTTAPRSACCRPASTRW